MNNNKIFYNVQLLVFKKSGRITLILWQLKNGVKYFVQDVIMTIITHDIIAVCLTVIRNNSGISNKIFCVYENRSLKINWHIMHRSVAKRTKEITKYLNSVRLFRQ